MLMMRSNQSKITPPPPVPPRPSKTVVAEALAKSRKLSPVRALYATQPLSALNKNEIRPVVPVRSAPPPPATKPKITRQIAQPQVVKSYSSAMVFNKLRNADDSNATRIVRSISDCGDDLIQNKSRTVVFQSSNLKSYKSAVNKNGDLNLKNERNNKVNEVKSEEKKQTIKVTTEEITKSSVSSSPPVEIETTRHCVQINTESELVQNTLQPKEIDKIVESVDDNKIIPPDHIALLPEIIDQVTSSTVEKVNNDASETIVQSSDKTMIIVTTDDANNNIFPQDEESGTYPSNHDTESNKSSKESTGERKKVQFDDKINHEILIAELQSMREEQERLLKRQRKPPVDIYDCDNDSVYSDRSSQSRIHHSDWVEVANNGEEVRLSSCQIYIDNPSEDSKSSSLSSRKSSVASRVPSMSSLHGLPPLPKSLSGFNLVENQTPPLTQRIETPRGTYRIPASPGPQTPSRAGSSRGPTPPTPGSGSGHVVYPPHPRVNGTTELPRGRKVTTLDTQLAILRREMYGLRQLDLSLLSQLYSLNEAIQDFRQILQDQEDQALSPHSPSPSPSSGDDGDEFYSPAPVRFKAAPPAPPLRRTSNSSSANSSEYGTV